MAQRGVHQDRGDRSAAEGLDDGQDPDFEDPDVELERELAAVDVLVEGVTIVVGRGDADETDDLAFRSTRRCSR